MAAPVAAYIQTPSDASNTGKKVRTQTRVVGSDTVHEHFFVRVSPRSKTGIYYANSNVLTLLASAQDGTSTGFAWLVNETGNTVKGAIRRIEFHSVPSAVTAMLTNPRIACRLFTFTGTPSGAAITVAKRDTTDASAQLDLRTAMTGLTITLTGIAYAFFPVMIATGVGVATPVLLEWEPVDEDGMPVIRTGEGMVLYQADAGTASDSRKAMINLAWEEYE